MLYTILEITLVFVAVALIIFILLQQGKGADAGAAFGSGASGTVFGAGGSANFLSHITAVLAAIFFVLALAMAYLSHHVAATPQSIVEKAVQQQSAATNAKEAAPQPVVPQTTPASKNPPPKSITASKPAPAKPPLH